MQPNLYKGLCIDSFVLGIFNERGGWWGICVEVNNGCVGERGGICYKVMLRNMGINLRGGDFRGILAVPAKKKEYRAKKSCDIIKWLLGCCGFE